MGGKKNTAITGNAGSIVPQYGSSKITVILLEPYCGTITEPGLPVRSYPTDITLGNRSFFSRAAEMLRGFGLNGDLTETGNRQ